MESAKQGPLGVFIAYAHEDDELCQEFIKHLIQIKRDGLIRAWHDRRLTGGSEWAGQIDEHLNSADIVVLLVSPDFLASQYCYDIEMKRALERDAAGEARVVPVILRSCDWQTSQFAKLTALPEDGKPVVKWETDRKSTRLNSSHLVISYAVFCLKKKKKNIIAHTYHLIWSRRERQHT